MGKRIPSQFKRHEMQKNKPHQNKYAELVGRTKSKKKVEDDAQYA